MVYADVHLRAFDCSNLIGRALFDQQRVLTESDIIREGAGYGRELKVYSLYIKDPTRRHRSPPTRSNLQRSNTGDITRERLSLRDFNHTRIISYGRNDWAVGAFMDRCLYILKEGPHIKIATINDAIEAHQLKLTLETAPELFEDAEGIDVTSAVPALFASACKYTRETLETSGILDVYEEIEMQYATQFWDLVHACGAEKLISGEGISELLSRHVECLAPILENDKLVKSFDAEIAKSLIDNPYYSADLLIREYATESSSQNAIHLPKCLSQGDFDSIMAGYLDDQRANPNYMEALFKWPSGSAKCKFSPSPDVRVRAKRAYDEAMDELFRQGTGLEYGAGVQIDPKQIACKGIKVDGLTMTYSFSETWLGKYTDHASIMNNCRYLLDVVDRSGLMAAPAHSHEESGLLATLGSHVLGEYRMNTISNMRESLAIVEVVAYAHFLESHGTRLEDALEWTYNVYFEEEYSIDGFTLALPSRGASWLDKCKSIGPEIERAVKSYSIYSRIGKIDGDYFPYESFKSFGELNALTEKKYAIGGASFERWGLYLFSDQCMLTYRRGHDDHVRCFYDLITKTMVTINDFDAAYAETLQQLVDRKLVSTCEETGALSPTRRSICLKAVWDNGAIALARCGEEDLSLIDGLVTDEMLSYSGKLFAPDEAAYLDYMFNDASFPNSQGLRNRYDHAHSPIADPNAASIQSDYYRMLSLLVAITLKINDELSTATGRGYLENFVDWPYYDESILELAKKMTTKRHETVGDTALK